MGRFNGGFGFGAEGMWTGCRVPGRESGGVRVMAGYAILPGDRTGIPLPVAAGPAMRAGFPVAVCRTMAATAERSAFHKLQLAAIARLKLLQVVLIVAIETQVVPVVTPVPHHHVRMLLRDQEVVFLIKPQRRRLAVLMARITIKIRKIRLGSDSIEAGYA